MMDKRHLDDRVHRFSIAAPTKEDPTLVRCPRCAARASIFPAGDKQVKVSCLKCGFSQITASDTLSLGWDEDNPTDGYFGFDLYLKCRCCGHWLWAFNKRHLEFLESYVSADLRERTRDNETGWRNASLASRLPKWIKAARNRPEILKAIKALWEKAK